MNFKIISVFIISALCFSSANIYKVPSTPWLYQVVAPSGQKAWLYGSIHTGVPSMYPLPQVVQKAFSQSQSLVVELRADHLDSSLTSLVKKLSQKSDTLKPRLSPKALKNWKSFAQKTMLPEPLLQMQRPWATAILLAQWQMENEGLNPNLGIDLHLTQKADKLKKKVLELETPATQVQVLASIPDSLGWLWINAELEQLYNTNNDGKKLIQAWKSGDCAQIQELELLPPTSAELANLAQDPQKKMQDSLLVQGLQNWFLQNLLKNRNVAMADSIFNWTLQGAQPFVVVGAAHLCNEFGLPELLRARGFKVIKF